MTSRSFSLRHFYLASALILSAPAAGCSGEVNGGGGGGGGEGGGGGGSDNNCEWGGQVYQVGDSFSAGDGCNTCTCEQGGIAACTLIACGCSYEGNFYLYGESFPAIDGCNTCTCEDGGTVSCTEKACSGGCNYYGEMHATGESFPAIDGCNTCACEMNGSVSCTEIACPCNPTNEWYRDYVSTDPMECLVISYQCPPNTTSFENSCGCGCEQGATCPQTFNCMPPATCDVAMLAEQCPYSQILF